MNFMSQTAAHGMAWIPKQAMEDSIEVLACGRGVYAELFCKLSEHREAASKLMELL